MIKIGPMVATDYGQASALLGLQEEPALDVVSLTEAGLALRSLAFWQHWVPCQFHVAPSIYVAREDGVVLGFISLRTVGKSKACWRIDNLIVDPQHRGRGVAQQLLRYVLAQFGSQGVSHFIAEAAANNDAALSLFAAGGFCRSARVSYYRLTPTGTDPLVDTLQESFRPATPLQRDLLFQLFQDSLPADLRLVLALAPEDFRIKELPPFTSIEFSKQRLLRRRVWYLISQDMERHTLTAATKITAQPGLGYRLDFAIHPGWRHLTTELVDSSINSLLSTAPPMPIWARVYDFQSQVHEALNNRQFESLGDYLLVAREHWQRSKHPKKRKAESSVGLAPISNPVINFPLATERHITSP